MSKNIDELLNELGTDDQLEGATDDAAEKEAVEKEASDLAAKEAAAKEASEAQSKADAELAAQTAKAAEAAAAAKAADEISKKPRRASARVEPTVPKVPDPDPVPTEEEAADEYAGLSAQTRAEMALGREMIRNRG